ncbi:MAG: DUF1273 family protein [Ruminococcaceae bacterium]|nr:DUF1273 family protein [Oscillospiraceae bacterium]
MKLESLRFFGAWLSFQVRLRTFLMPRYAMNKLKTCCFFGHRKISLNDSLKSKLYAIIENLIVDGVEIFLFGSKSDFDNLCHEVVTELKQRYPHIQRVYVRAEYPEINIDYKKYLLKYYEETYFPQRAVNAGRAVYIERNYELIDRSDICIVYYIKDYTPPRRKNSKKDLTDYQPKSGTGIAYAYAQRKQKQIINIGESYAAP